MRTGVFRAFVVLVGLMGAATASAQPTTSSGPSVVEGDVVEGRVSRVDPQARTVTLDNGQEYVVPDGLPLNWERLRPGAAVKMRFNVDGGRNLATALDVRP